MSASSIHSGTLENRSSSTSSAEPSGAASVLPPTSTAAMTPGRLGQARVGCRVRQRRSMPRRRSGTRPRTAGSTASTMAAAPGRRWWLPRTADPTRLPSGSAVDLGTDAADETVESSCGGPCRERADRGGGSAGFTELCPCSVLTSPMRCAVGWLLCRIARRRWASAPPSPSWHRWSCKSTTQTHGPDRAGLLLGQPTSRVRSPA